jgi:hypothetical protein
LPSLCKERLNCDGHQFLLLLPSRRYWWPSQFNLSLHNDGNKRRNWWPSQFNLNSSSYCHHYVKRD